MLFSSLKVHVFFIYAQSHVYGVKHSFGKIGPQSQNFDAGRVAPAAGPERSARARGGESGAAGSRVGAPQHSAVAPRGRSISSVGQFEGTGRPRRIQPPTQNKDGAFPLHPETLPRRSGESRPFLSSLRFSFSHPFSTALPSAGVSRRSHALSRLSNEFISHLFDTARK